MSELAPTCGVSPAWELLDLPRSSFYYPVDEPDASDCKGAIQKTTGQWFRYGTMGATRARRASIKFKRPPANGLVTAIAGTLSSCGEKSNWWSTASECGV